MTSAAIPPTVPAQLATTWRGTAFLRYFSEARPLLVGPPRNSKSIPSSVMTLSTKMAPPVTRFIFFVFVSRWSFNVDFKFSYTIFFNIATLFRSPINALHGLAV